MNRGIECVCDSAYLGIFKVHAYARIPKKSSKLKPLTVVEKLYNWALAKERVVNEWVIGILKRFRILAERYRNRRKRFHLRFSLIAGIYNFELAQ